MVVLDALTEESCWTWYVDVLPMQNCQKLELVTNVYTKKKNIHLLHLDSVVRLHLHRPFNKQTDYVFRWRTLHRIVSSI